MRNALQPVCAPTPSGDLHPAELEHSIPGTRRGAQKQQSFKATKGIPVAGCIPLHNYSSRLEGSLGGDTLGVQGMDVLAGRKHGRVPDRISSWPRLHILTF